ncbi:DNA mismatch repair protein MSH6 [Tanacetum coccineum]|uniref:DNA mismatch repair protein MSH6 n=1 Tax=Tanacetum coccineum TaxID=301880 RepID=A0ABQ5B0S4_9ASTR
MSIKGRIIPRDGVDEVYDTACGVVTDIELNLTKHLKEQRKLIGDSSVNYVSIGKDSYLLEVPKSLCGSLPSDYELQSSKKGFSRYWTPTIKKYIRELSDAKSEKESKLKSIMHRLIRRFCEHHISWRQLVSIAAASYFSKLDLLISIAIASDLYEGPTCRPLIMDTFIVLTGPNMGGMSTLLRQVCLAVILAQVGADVPAKSFKMSPVDHIFVQMGAKDHIMAGQSTFLIELLETASMLSSATHSSLMALEELGRGTSMSDGQAISIIRAACSSVMNAALVLCNTAIACDGVLDSGVDEDSADRRET